jgi:hypothetical protein
MVLTSAASERLAVRMSRAHIRFVEDTTIALKEAEPAKADIEDALRDQLGHGRRLLAMAETACRCLASPSGLPPAIHKEMSWASTVALKDFRDLQEAVLSWTRTHGALEGAHELAALLAELGDLQAELCSWRELQEEVPFDPELIRQARAAYDRGDFQELAEVIRDLQTPHPPTG